MKHLKMLGLGVIAAMGLMALVGAGAASATTLFTDSNLMTPYASGTSFHLTLSSGSSSLFTGGSGEALITCSVSTIKGKTSNETGTTVSGSIAALTWGSCSTTLDTIKTGSLSIEEISTDEGRIVGRNSEWTYDIFGVSCTYGTGIGTTLGTITGGEAPKFSIKSVSLTKTAGGFLCPTTAGWDAEYTFTEPHELHIGA